MNCRHAQANFSGYLEQELSEDERRQVAAHLARCSRCSTDLFAMQKAMNLVRWVPRVEGSPEFEERLMQRIAAEARQEHSRGRWRDVIASFGEWWDELAAAVMMPAPAGALVVALLVGGGGGMLLMRLAPSNQPAGGVPIAELPAAGPETNPAEPIVVPVEAEPTKLVQGEETKTPPPVVQARVEPAPRKKSTEPRSDVQVASTNSPDSPSPGADGETVQLASSRSAVKAGTPEGVDVAPWHVNGQPIEATPEGPPAVMAVDYVLPVMTGRPVDQLPSSAVVSGKTVTF